MKFDQLKQGDEISCQLASRKTYLDRVEGEFYSFCTNSGFCYILLSLTGIEKNEWFRPFPSNFLCNYRKLQHRFYKCVYWEIVGCEL